MNTDNFPYKKEALEFKETVESKFNSLPYLQRIGVVVVVVLVLTALLGGGAYVFATSGNDTKKTEPEPDIAAENSFQQTEEDGWMKFQLTAKDEVDKIVIEGQPLDQKVETTETGKTIKVSSANSKVHMYLLRDGQRVYNETFKPEGPNVFLATSSTEIYTGETIELAVGQPSSEKDKDVVLIEGKGSTVSWDLNDDGAPEQEGAVEDVGKVEYTYDEPGTYTVTVTYATSDNTTSTLQQDITVLPQKPTAAFKTNGDHDATAPAEVTFDASSSSSPTGSLEYQWDFNGDGQFEETTTEPTISYEYDQAGEYDVTLVVKDENYQVATTQTITIDASEEE